MSVATSPKPNTPLQYLGFEGRVVRRLHWPMYDVREYYFENKETAYGAPNTCYRRGKASVSLAP